MVRSRVVRAWMGMDGQPSKESAEIWARRAHLALRLAKQLRDELRVVLRELTALLEARPTGRGQRGIMTGAKRAVQQVESTNLENDGLVFAAI